MKAIALLVTLALGLLVAPVSIEAQKAEMATVGYLAPACGWTCKQLRGRLHELGWVEGKNIAFEYAVWEKQRDRIPQLAAQLARRKVDVILAVGPAGVAAAKGATDTIPIVMIYATDPEYFGWVKSIGRPGGNVTGLTWDAGRFEVAKKALEFFTAALPQARKFAALWTLGNPSHPAYLEAAETVAPRFGIKILSAPVRRADELEGAFQRMSAEGADVVWVWTDSLTIPNRDRIMSLAFAHRLPVLLTADFGFKGALIVFGPHIPGMPQRAAEYVDKILRGADPANLPVEQPLKYDIIINLETAKAFGLTIPDSVLFRADKVIK